MTAASKTTDKRRIRGEESRRSILRAAIDSIAELGLGKLTLDRVAEKAGISRGLVVFHFKSKQRLIEAVLDYLGKRYASGWRAIVQQDDDDVRKLLRLIDYDIRFACENTKYLSAWHAFWGDAQGNQLFQQRALPRDETYAADLARLLERICRQGGYDRRELASITRALIAMMFGIWLQLHLDPGPDDYRINSNAVRLMLEKAFPRTRFPRV